MALKKIANSISIISVNYNGGEQNLQLLTSIENLNFPKNKIQVIVVDNHSTDGSDKAIMEKFPNTILLKQKTNLGYGPAINIAIKKAVGQFIFIVNNDIILDANCPKLLLDFIKNNSNIGIVGPKLLPVKKKAQTAQYQKFNYWTGHVDMRSKIINKPTEVQWIQGCAMFMPKEICQKIGYFDEGFSKIYFEDIDYCVRTQAKGMRTLIYPKAVCYHLQSFTVDKISLSRKWYYWHKNKIRFVIKHANFLQMITVISFEILASFYWTFIKKQPNIKSLIKAIAVNTKNLNQTLSLRENGKAE